MIEAFIIAWLGVALFVFARFKLSKNPTYRPFAFLKLIGITITALAVIKILLVIFNVL